MSDMVDVMSVCSDVDDKLKSMDYDDQVGSRFGVRRFTDPDVLLLIYPYQRHP